MSIFIKPNEGSRREERQMGTNMAAFLGVSRRRVNIQVPHNLDAQTVMVVNTLATSDVPVGS